MMKLPTQMLLIVIFLHLFIPHSVEFEEDEEEVNPLDFAYDVTSQTMKKGGKNENIIELQECKKNLTAEENVKKEVQLSLQECKKNLEIANKARVKITSTLEEVQLSLQDCSTRFETLKDEKIQLERIIEEQKISQQEQEDATSVCELQNQNLEKETQSLKFEVAKLEEEAAKWKKLLILLFTLAVGAMVTIAVVHLIFPRATQPHVDVPDQQDEAHQQGPPNQENVQLQQDAAPPQNIPAQHQHDDDQHSREGHHGGSHRQINLVDPSFEVGAVQSEGIMEEEGGTLPLDGSPQGERNLVDPSIEVSAIQPEGIIEGTRLDEVYQTATPNSEYESSLPVQPMDD